MGFVVSIFAGSLACFSLMFFRFCLLRRFFFRLLLMCFRFMENPAIDPIFFPIFLGARRLGCLLQDSQVVSARVVVTPVQVRKIRS